MLPNFTIKQIHSDYEIAEMLAIEEVFGRNVLHGCLFHFVKAALMHLRTKCPAIFNVYISEKKEKGPFYKWVFFYYCLAKKINLDSKNSCSPAPS